jgi:nitrite reductase/ring-hydroxylating ferredoxin subunit
VGGTTLVCPLHAWKFELSSGKVLLGSQGIATYPIALTEQGDMVLKFGGLS